MSEQASDPVIIKDQVIRVHPDMAWERAARLGDILSSVSEAIPEITMAAGAFTAAWKEQQAIALVGENADKDMLADAMATVEDPPPSQLIGLLFPSIWKVARTELLQLLAIVTVSDDDLFKADEEGGDEAIQQRLDAQAKLLRRAQLKDLVQLAIEAVPAVTEQLQAVTEALGEGGELGKLTQAQS